MARMPPPMTPGASRGHSPSPYSHGHGHGYGGALEAGRMKTDQVVVEFLYKVTELVLQSRVHLQVDTEPGRGNRRARFNLDIEELPFIREAMVLWKEDVHKPLAVDIYWDGANTSDRRVLLERWSVEYAYQEDASSAHDHYYGRRHSMSSVNAATMSAAANSRDVIQQLKEVCRKIAVVLRALHSFMRQLPAHRFFRDSYPSTLSYEIHAGKPNQQDGYDHVDATGFMDNGQEVATSQYSFLPIATPFGVLKVSALYRRDCAKLEERRRSSAEPLFMETAIIQDYVPNSPELLRTPTSTSAPPTLHNQRELDEEFTDHHDRGHERRRRSSPLEIHKEDVPTLPQSHGKGISQPMAIPQHAKSPASHDGEGARSPSSALSPQQDAVGGGMRFAHSYGDPERMRTATTNPHVTPAPYGYGNVAIERGIVHGSPLTMSMLGGAGTTSGGGGNVAAAGGGGAFSSSFQDHTGSSPHPLSTPPRHPHSLLTPKTGRPSLLSSSGGKKLSNEFAYRASLENFSLDGSTGVAGGSQQKYGPQATNPTQIPDAPGHHHHTYHVGGTRRLSASPDDEADTANQLAEAGASGFSPQMTPPFMAESPPVSSGHRVGLDNDAGATGTDSGALVLRNASPDTRSNSDGARVSTGLPSFDASPPFQANPSELLSTSPGYAYGKHLQRFHQRGSPQYISTDHRHPHHGRSANLRLMGSPADAVVGSEPASIEKYSSQSKARTFSSDVYEQGGGLWGISPDTPDSFEFTISTHSNLRRRRPSSSDADQAEDMEGDENASSQYDGDMDADMLLPFAIGDDDTTSSATTTVTTTSTVSERTLSSADSGSRNQTASLGNFLQQLKHAPRLQVFDTSAAAAKSAKEQEAGNTQATSAHAGASSSRAPSFQVSFFDDELASFRLLRDEITHEL